MSGRKFAFDKKLRKSWLVTRKKTDQDQPACLYSCLYSSTQTANLSIYFTLLSFSRLQESSWEQIELPRATPSLLSGVVLPSAALPRGE